MTYESIQRTLWYVDKSNHAELTQVGLLNRNEPLVILGEAGMGKSHLLEWLTQMPGYRKCTARQLINRENPKSLLGDGKILVIDAIDELSSKQESDAVDLVLRQLGKLDYPTFVLSCRAADWRSATGLEAIREQYEKEPLELHLRPFDDNDVISFLSSRLDSMHAQNVINHFNDRGLNGLLGNPQTLDLIVNVARRGSLPETSSALFENAIEALRTEHRDSKAGLQPATVIGIDAAGAAFAGLILTGSEAIVRTAAAKTAEGEVQLADISTLPQGEAIGTMLGTRLFKSDGADRFSYWHRRIGEFLGAQWLAKQASSPSKRHRLLSLFHSHGLVPASLRGIHAWLARDPALAAKVITADPVGVIEYGDADCLTTEQARILLKALAPLAADNPYLFGRDHYTVRGIMQPALINDIRQLITTHSTPFSLCLLILKALKDSTLALELACDLEALIIDKAATFACRKAAGKALSKLASNAKWLTIIQTLYTHGDPLSLRLAIELMHEIGYSPFSDKLIANLVLAYITADDRTLGVLMYLEQEFPDERIDYLLDQLTAVAKAWSREQRSSRYNNLTDFVRHLIVRRITTSTPTKKLSSWLEPFDNWSGHQYETRKRLNTLILEDDTLRRQVQHLVLIEQPSSLTIQQRYYHLLQRSPSFSLSSEDAVFLLETLNPTDQNDERWRSIVQLTHHNEDIGENARAAAIRFAIHCPSLLAWIDTLAVPKISQYEIEDAKRRERLLAKQTVKDAELRKSFMTQIDEMRAGNYNSLIAPAKAYLNLHSDNERPEPAHKRLGDEINEAAHTGFEIFLVHACTKPTAHDISQKIAQDRDWSWDASYIIITALIERRRKNTGLDDLTNDRLMAALLSLRHRGIEVRAGVTDLEEMVETELKMRNLWTDSMRMLYEPKLAAKYKYLDGLDALMRNEAQAPIACELARDWLMRFPDIQYDQEYALIKRLIRSCKIEDLRAAAATRIALTEVERQHNWDAVNLLTDFSHTVERLKAQPIEPPLLWHLQLCTNKRIDNNITYLALLEWILSTFRSLWPMTCRPKGVTHGDTNPWDASDYLINLIRRLGNDPSEDARAALKQLQEGVSDGYTQTIKSVAAEQARLRTEAAYQSPTLEAINAIARDTPPLNAADLQAFMMEKLKIAQSKINHDDAESWRGFYGDDAAPYAEERCRDHLMGLLRQESEGVTLAPEVHVAGDKEVDIACSVGTLRLPIEIKGQWHKELWKGADAQLDRLYTPDWRAGGRGIYLVLWFGNRVAKNKQLKSPGRGTTRPNSPDELRDMLYAGSHSAREGRVTVFVIDLERK